MARKGLVESNLRRRKIVSKYSGKRKELKENSRSSESSIDDRFNLSIKMAKLPRNSSPVRIRNRCLLTGRPRGFYRKFKLSRITLRDLASLGLVPGMTKSSW